MNHIQCFFFSFRITKYNFKKPTIYIYFILYIITTTTTIGIELKPSMATKILSHPNLSVYIYIYICVLYYIYIAALSNVK